MKAGEAVFQDYQGIRRYGVVTSTADKKDGWRYAKVRWFNDHIYERAMNTLSELRGGKDFAVYEYRVDNIRRIDVSHEMATLNKILEFQAVLRTEKVA